MTDHTPVPFESAGTRRVRYHDGGPLKPLERTMDDELRAAADLVREVFKGSDQAPITGSDEFWDALHTLAYQYLAEHPADDG